MQKPFYGPKLKVKRAKQHIAELNESIKGFINTDFCRVVVDENPQTGEHVLSFIMTKQIPETIPLIIGDAIHNMHSALDIMMCDIILLHNGAITRYTKFPFRSTKQELEAALQNREIKIVGPQTISLIVDTIKPYKGGNDLLYALHSLDIDDKHILLLPVFSVAALTNVNGTAGGCTFTVGQGGKLNILGMPGKFQFQGYGKPAISVIFDKGQSLEGQSVIPTLHQILQLVSGIIQTFEAHYTGSQKP